MGKLNDKLSENRAHLIDFDNCSSNQPIFSFYRGTNNNTLFLITPQDKIGTQINNINTHFVEVKTSLLLAQFASEKA